ncbi:hypothetical protein HPB47_005887 [Ixodes persulcatus]|uniref:Uncharacterized protein n=1 Tax=Ixodes persulcatus TaxID=34615 RepID=A0AC60PBQ8_IXOPE|nr:hypothetical protein HPB47_005887 [Ixodes persulcatus]
MGPGIEYAIFGSLMAANLGLGLYFSVFKKTRERSSNEVFLGSRTLASIPLAMSAIASLISTMGIVGLGAHFYAFGFHYDWSLLATVVVLPVVVYVIVPTLYQLKVTSVFEGGFRGVVWTDSVQCVIMLLAPLTVIVKVVYDLTTTNVRLSPPSSVPIQDYIFNSRDDPQAIEKNNLRVMMRGVKIDIFGALDCNQPAAVDKFVAEAMNIESARSARLWLRHWHPPD